MSVSELLLLIIIIVIIAYYHLRVGSGPQVIFVDNALCDTRKTHVQQIALRKTSVSKQLVSLMLRLG